MITTSTRSSYEYETRAHDAGDCVIVNAVDTRCFKYMLYVLWSKCIGSGHDYVSVLEAVGEFPVSSRVKVRFACAFCRRQEQIKLFCSLSL